MIGEDLKIFRTAQGWSQARLGDELGVARNTVARWERGEMAIPPFLSLALTELERRAPASKTAKKKPKKQP